MSETRQRSKTIVVRATEAEEAAIRAKAQDAGVSVSAFVRAAALARKLPSPPPALLAGLANLGQLGGLLKLALAQSDQGKAPAAVRAQLEATLASIRGAADEVRAQLR